MNKCFYRKRSHAVIGLLASVVYTIMAHCHKGYMNIVDVFGSQPSTQLKRFIYYLISGLPTVFSPLSLSLSLQVKVLNNVAIALRGFQSCKVRLWSKTGITIVLLTSHICHIWVKLSLASHTCLLATMHLKVRIRIKVKLGNSWIGNSTSNNRGVVQDK